MIYTTIIVDDEPLARLRLRNLLADHSDKIRIIGEAGHGTEAIELINRLRPDLIMLDVQMPGLNGFEILPRLESIPLIIFTTAYDEYALQAFETNSVDYLLKPIEPERLARAISKLDLFAGSGDSVLENRIKDLLHSVEIAHKKQLQVSIGNKTVLIKTQDVYFIRSEDKYNFLYTYDRRFLTGFTLTELEQDLGNNFRRIHRSCLVNIDHVREIIKLSASRHVVIMDDRSGSELIISRKGRKNLIPSE